LFIVIASSILAGTVRAGDFPSHYLTMIVPFGAGGPQDSLARVIAQAMSGVLGQQVVIENIGGSGGGTGARRAADAAPDGYTMLLGTVGTHAQNQTLYKHPAYDAISDFTPVSLVAETPLALIARNDLPVKGLGEFVSYARARQAEMQYGSSGLGSATHLGCVMLDAAMGTHVTNVSYRSTGQAMQDLQAGRLDYLCDILATAKPQIDAGAVKCLALLSRSRSPVMPDTPTATEQGLDVEAYTWSAIFLPKGAPADIVARLNAAAVAAVNAPSTRSHLQELGAVVVSPDRQSPQYLADFVRSEIAKWAAPIRASGASVD
jgi:tripartite-type tricarboxylate transporter receptor subunit TctC